MPRTFISCILCCVTTILLPELCRNAARGQTVWSGFDLTFSKPNGADPDLPENQDQITGNVWITRGSTGGIYNYALESDYSSFAPADTEWATDMNNPGETIDATNWANLAFAPWLDAYGGAASGMLPNRLLSRSAVVHLITDDIYLDLRFTAWGIAGEGGFAYERAVGVPEPAAAVLLAIGCVILAWRPVVRR